MCVCEIFFIVIYFNYQFFLLLNLNSPWKTFPYAQDRENFFLLILVHTFPPSL